jgi:hypothetical protein
LNTKDIRVIFLQSEAKDLSSCLFSTIYEQLQGCFASLSMTDSDSFTPSRLSGLAASFVSARQAAEPQDVANVNEGHLGKAGPGGRPLCGGARASQGALPRRSGDLTERSRNVYEKKG